MNNYYDSSTGKTTNRAEGGGGMMCKSDKWLLTNDPKYGGQTELHK